MADNTAPNETTQKLSGPNETTSKDISQKGVEPNETTPKNTAPNNTAPKVINYSEKSDEKFSVEDFMENAKALGYKEYVLAGALYDCKKEDKLTKEEVKQRVKEFLGKKVK